MKEYYLWSIQKDMIILFVLYRHVKPTNKNVLHTNVVCSNYHREGHHGYRKITSEEAKKIKGKTNWDEVDSLTDEDIEKSAKDDPDTSMPTEQELENFKPIEKYKKE